MSPSNGQVLTYNSSSGLWEPQIMNEEFIRDTLGSIFTSSNTVNITYNDDGSNAGSVYADLKLSGGVNNNAFTTSSVGLDLKTSISGQRTFVDGLIVEDGLQVTGSVYLASSNTQIVVVNGQLNIPIFTSASLPAIYISSPETVPGHTFYLSGSGTTSGSFQQGNKWYFNENGTWFPSSFRTE
jgi:hypothetical protein